MARTSTGLSDDEVRLLETVRQFVDKEVRPTVREREHANEYPEAWIEQMKRIGFYALTEPGGDSDLQNMSATALPDRAGYCRTTMTVFPGRRPGCCPLSNASRPCERGKVAPISTCN